MNPTIIPFLSVMLRNKLKFGLNNYNGSFRFGEETEMKFLKNFSPTDSKFATLVNDISWRERRLFNLLGFELQLATIVDSFSATHVHYREII